MNLRVHVKAVFVLTAKNHREVRTNYFNKSSRLIEPGAENLVKMLSRAFRAHSSTALNPPITDLTPPTTTDLTSIPL